MKTNRKETAEVLVPYDVSAWPTPKQGKAVVDLTIWGARAEIVDVPKRRTPRLSLTGAMLKSVEDEIRWAYRLVSRLPGACGPLGNGSQLGNMVAEEGDVVVRLPPAASEIDRAHHVIESINDALDDVFERYMVHSRGVNRSWRFIRDRDPRARQLCQLHRVYRQAIGKIYVCTNVGHSTKK